MANQDRTSNLSQVYKVHCTLTQNALFLRLLTAVKDSLISALMLYWPGCSGLTVLVLPLCCLLPEFRTMEPSFTFWLYLYRPAGFSRQILKHFPQIVTFPLQPVVKITQLNTFFNVLLFFTYFQSFHSSCACVCLILTLSSFSRYLKVHLGAWWRDARLVYCKIFKKKIRIVKKLNMFL